MLLSVWRDYKSLILTRESGSVKGPLLMHLRWLLMHHKKVNVGPI